ncbi:MAG: hypothetical protein ABR577_13565, partial [Pyrinomonadaceae bacterium]
MVTFEHPDRDGVAGDLLARLPDVERVLVHAPRRRDEHDEQHGDDQDDDRARDERVSPERHRVHVLSYCGLVIVDCGLKEMFFKSAFPNPK